MKNLFMQLVTLIALFGHTQPLGISKVNKNFKNIGNGNKNSAPLDDGLSFQEKVTAYRKANAPKKLLVEAKSMATAKTLSQNMTLYIFRNLQRMNRTDLLEELVPVWLQITEKIEPASIDLDCASTILRSMCRLGALQAAEAIAVRAGACLDQTQAKQHVSDITLQQQTFDPSNSPYFQINISSAAISSNASSMMDATHKLLPDLALGMTMRGYYDRAISLLTVMNIFSLTIDLDTSKQILKWMLRESSANVARRCLHALLLLDGM